MHLLVVVDLAYFKSLLQAEKQVLNDFEQKKEKLRDDVYSQEVI